ncbi:MAG TPA: DNA polymerase III subunit alpha, partial [Streptosporangiaceae bacterium]
MAVSGEPFAHLHVHTEYSMLDGAARLKELLAEVKNLGMTHVAMTDHGNLMGAAEFHKQAKQAGITPVIGIEAYVAPEARGNQQRILWGQPHQKKDDVSAGGAYLHKTIWARDAEGLHNLFRLSSRSYAEGWLVKWPRMDKELIAAHTGGLMASTGCPSGEVQTRLLLGQFDEALAAAAQWQDIFGKENYFLELMDHGLDIERRVRDGLVEIGRKLGIPPVVTNDSHYTREPDAQAQDMLLCIQTGKTLADQDRFRFEGTGYFIKPAAEMYRQDGSDLWQEGCRNSQLLIADRVDASGMFEYRNLMPRFPLPEGFESEAELFAAEAWKGMDRRYPGGYDEQRRKQAEYEIGIICQMGFPGYFLVVADFIMWAKNNGIAVGPGRGSAAGSIVSYALGITDLDPIVHGLMFERFLNPERLSMPDIDVDFDERGRGDVIRYVTQKWGSDRVAQIVTFGTIK